MKFLPLLAMTLALLLAGGCKPKPKDIPPLQRKQAANLVSEAQFALALRDFARAEPLLQQAAKLCPDNGEYWLSLGVARRRQGDKSGAKAAYEHAREAFHDAYRIEPNQTESVLQEIYVLALLGRADDARQLLEKARKQAPEDRGLRSFAEGRQLDQMLGDPTFKDVAL